MKGSSVSRERHGSDGDGSTGGLTDASGSFDQDAVKDVALPVLDRWTSERTIGDVRRRLRWILVASALVVVLGLVYEPPGLTGFLLQIWTLASVPIAALSGAVYATVRNPKQARSVWWDSGLLVTVGLIAIAALAQSGQRSAYGRAAWQLLFGDDSPTGVDYRFDRADDTVDLSSVAEIRRQARNVIAISLLIAGLDTIARRFGDELVAIVVAVISGDPVSAPGADPLPAIPFLTPSNPLEYVLLVLATAIVGVVIGFFVALRRDL